MKLTKSVVVPALLAALSLGSVAAFARSTATRHPVVAATLPRGGAEAPHASFEALVDEPGPVTVETVVGAAWHVDRGGLLNLAHPKAKAAGLKEGQEPIVLLFHALHHPTRGLFLVDSGAERAFRDDPPHALMHGLVGSLAHAADLVVRTDTAGWLATQKEPLRGVFLTHLHLDHVSGLRDVPSAVPVFVGPGEASSRGVMNVFTSGIVDDALEGKGPLEELSFPKDPDGHFEGLLDLFGDGSVWALWVPGHTAGSTAFLVRTPAGPVLLTGDACHTAWGWQNRVEPGTFSDDPKRSAESLARLEDLAARHPHLEVRLGHQVLPASP